MMPSILSRFGSEPVSLETDEASPYEPPHLASKETNGHPSPKLKSRVKDGSDRNSMSKDQTSEDDSPDLMDNANASLHSLPNGRSSDSMESRYDPKPEKSTHSPFMNGNITHDEGRSVSSSNAKNGILHPPSPDQTIYEDKSTTNGNVPLNSSDERVSQQPTPNGHCSASENHDHIQSTKSHHKGHSRIHSNSVPHAVSGHDLPNKDVDKSLVKSATGTLTQDTPQQTKRTQLIPPDIATTPMTSPAKPSHPVAPRLQHRHTLEVPRASMNGTRSSRDFSSPNTVTDGGSESGRLSPGLRTPRASNTMARGPPRSVHSEIYTDEIPQDGDMARWTETVRQKRASRRRKKEEEEDDRVVVGTKVDMNHVNWVTAYNMLTGIRFTVSRTNAKIDRELTDADFDARHKFSFDITGNELTPSAKYDFKFKDYAPWVFRHLRAKFKLDPADYLMSLTSKYILSELGSPGKSGSFFYFSRDYKYIIKTIHHAEHKLLRKILREYYAHVEKFPNTLISQFYGLHRVKIPYGRKIHFVVMNNLFPPHRDIHQTFDLKGSTIGRNFTEENLVHNPRATLKDLNWLRRNNHFEFGPQKKSLFVEQMQRDVALLQKLKIMDYSLLVGIHDLNRGNEENLRDKTLQVFQPGGEGNPEPQVNMLTRTPSKLENQRQARQLRQIIKKEKPVPMDKSTSKMPDEMLEERKNFIFYSDDGGFRASHEDGRPGEEIYYLGIIDCLTHYGIVKKAEHFWKGLTNDSKQISPIPPEGYGDRFVKFIGGLTMTREEAEKGKVRHEQANGYVPGVQPDFNVPFSRRSTDGKSSGRKSTDRVSTEKVVQKAEAQAEKAQRDGSIEEPNRERTLSSTRSPSTDRVSGIQGATLPVVEEAGESGSKEESIRDEKSVLPTPNGFTESRPSHKPLTDASVEGQKLPSIPNFNRLSMGLGRPTPNT